MTEFIEYLKNGTVPADRTNARQLELRATRYTLIDDQLYKRAFSLPLLKCITPEEGQIILSEIHDGISGNHAGGRALIHKTIRQGFFWQTLRKDALAYAR